MARYSNVRLSIPLPLMRSCMARLESMVTLCMSIARPVWARRGYHPKTCSCCLRKMSCLAWIGHPELCCGSHWRRDMKHTKGQLLTFKVHQAVGSMAIEGIQVSKQSEAIMLDVAAGRVSGKSVREQLVAKYKQVSSAS